MGRGGYRQGSGAKPKWKSGETTTIRVPVALADRIIGIARKLDDGKSIDCDTKPKLDLTQLKVYKLHGRDVVRVDDLTKQTRE